MCALGLSFSLGVGWSRARNADHRQAAVSGRGNMT